MDPSKNYYPPMHTAEHILNQTMVRMFNCGRSVNNHIEKKKSKCDYSFNRLPDAGEISEVVKRVNEVIQENLAVTEEFMDYQEALEKYNLEKLPPDTDGKIRIIKIGDYDYCPCIGQHVKNTAEIGVFDIISYTYENGILRIRFKLNTE